MAEAARPDRLSGQLVQRSQHAVVAELEDAVAADDRRELEQRVRVVDPQLAKRRVQRRRRGKEARVFGRVAVERPGDRLFDLLRRQLRRRLGHEARVRVVDAAGAVVLVEVAGERERDDEHDEPAEDQPDTFRARKQALEAIAHGEMARRVRRRSCETGAER